MDIHTTREIKDGRFFLEEDKLRGLAKESSQVMRAREKLLKKIEEEKKQFTPDALHRMKEKIYKQIAAYAAHRVPLTEKSIGLFDQNEHAASISRRIQKFAQQLQEELGSFGRS